ncbi:hypothetical protein HZB07_00335 [Candidatus Saganbacteria bacterium]|nr:hypothetical protein [Candidatus Saganbacteria bacterium]
MKKINWLLTILLTATSFGWAANFPLYSQKQHNAFYKQLEQKAPYPEQYSTAELNKLIAQIEGDLKAALPEKNKELGIYYHAKAVRKEGRLQDAEQAVKYLQIALDQLKESSRETTELANNLRGWLGGVYALKPKFGLSIFEILKTTNQGTSMLDRAIYNNPVDLELRFLRANTYIYFPKFLGKAQTVISDLDYLSAYFRTYYQENSDVILKIYAMLCCAHKENGASSQARFYLQKLQKIAPDSVYYKKAKELCGI